MRIDNVVETHISRVLFSGGRAYKVKKPVTMPFLDYGTLEARRHFCFEEVRLNRRLAPGFYLGVRALVHGKDGKTELADPDAPDAYEYAVEMLPVPADRTLAALVATGTLTPADITAVARRLADFHLTAVRVATTPDGEAAFRRQLDAALGTLRQRSAPGDRPLATRLSQALGLLTEAHADELRLRARQGLVRDCHGDLRAEHVIVGDAVEVFDCIEFSAELRQIDVGCDLAFLLMDLERLDAGRTAERLLGAYRAAGGHPGSDGLVALFAAYRAVVRATVALLRAEQLAGAPRERERQEARGLVRLAWRFAWRSAGPLVVAVCGPAAVGKTRLSLELEAVSGLRRLSSDRTRKRLVGVQPTERAPRSAYTREMNAHVYEALGTDAAGERNGAIVDATFRHRADRDAFRAGLGSIQPLFVECSADAATIAARALARLGDARRESDAGLRVALEQAAHFEPLTEIDPDRRIRVRTDRAADQLAASVGVEAARLSAARRSSSAPQTSTGNGRVKTTASHGSAAVANAG
jgi:aminoglycoside phosphotransferase family enzyme/predicted kinase